MLKMVALDLDNTLLDSDGSVCDSTRDVLQRLSEQGTAIALCSGRPVEPLRELSKRLSIDTSIVSFNGAVVVPFKCEPIQNLIPKRTVESLVAFCYAEGLYIHYYYNGKIYLDSVCDLTSHDLVTKVAPLVELGDMTAIELKPACKAMILTEPGIEQDVQAHLSEAFPNLNAVISDKCVIEVMCGKVSKSYGLSILCSKLGIAREEVVAFGDNYNDMDMIQWAGTGVAVNNAVDELKDAADIISKRDRSQGVGEVLGELFSDQLN